MHREQQPPQLPMEEFEESFCHSSASSITCSLWSSGQSSAFTFDRNSRSTLSTLSFGSPISNDSSLSASLFMEDDNLLNSRRWNVSANNDSLLNSPLISPGLQKGERRPSIQHHVLPAVPQPPPLVVGDEDSPGKPATPTSSTRTSSSFEASIATFPSPPISSSSASPPKTGWELREEFKRRTLHDCSPQMPKRSWHGDHDEGNNTWRNKGDLVEQAISIVNSTSTNQSSIKKKELHQKELSSKPICSVPAASKSVTTTTTKMIPQKKSLLRPSVSGDDTSSTSTASAAPLIGASRWDSNNHEIPLPPNSTTPKASNSRKTLNRKSSTSSSSSKKMMKNSSVVAPKKKRDSSTAPKQPPLRQKSRDALPADEPSPKLSSSSSSLNKQQEKKDTTTTTTTTTQNKKKKSSYTQLRNFPRKQISRHKSDNRRRSTRMIQDSLTRILEVENEGDESYYGATAHHHDPNNSSSTQGQRRQVFARKSCPNIQVPTLFTSHEILFSSSPSPSEEEQEESKSKSSSNNNNKDQSTQRWSGVGSRHLTCK